MDFISTLIPGTLQRRYKRFFADVLLDDGTEVVAHCPNTGAMTGCAQPGFRVWVRRVDDPKRKLKYSWELSINHQQEWIGINTHNANKLVAEALSSHAIAPLASYTSVRREVKFGEENSRIDFLLQQDGVMDCYVEVKSVTLLRNGCGYFPDAVTTRGQKHLRELEMVRRLGHRAVILFCVQHTGISALRIAKDIDTEYFQAFESARQNGVEVLAYGCVISQQKITLNQELPIKT